MKQSPRLLPLLLFCWGANGQTTPAPGGETTVPEVASRDDSPSFRSRVNLVVVPVVVRDGKGRVIAELKKEDFELYDKGKRQEVTRFSVEKPAAPGDPNKKAAPPRSDAITEAAEPSSPSPAPDIPDHYIAYLFDDVHLKFEDLVYVRDAARRNMDSALRPTDRAAIFTTSGRVTADFTGDKTKLHEALEKLRPNPISRVANQCPDVSYYMADLIVDKQDRQALSAATQDALTCLQLDASMPGALQTAQNAANSASRLMLSAGNHETQINYTVLSDVIRRISFMPGQKTMILVSPGFYSTFDHRDEERDVLEKALHSNIVINALDARGLYTPPMFDASSRVNGQTVALESQYASASATAEGETLAELAYGTGGTFVQNTNDYDGGFRRVASTPECIYMLGFSPANLKLDGSYHSLKIKLASGLKFELQARKGYYAPKHLADAAENAKQEIQEAVFSREETHDLPVDLNTQYFRAADAQATLSVMARVDLRQLHFRKAEGRNKNDLTLVAALFDRDGNFVKATEKTVTMRLKDDTITKVPSITVKTSFDVPPGRYVVRLVIRDGEQQMMTTQNRAVEIPF